MLSLTCLVLVSTLTMSYGDLDKSFANLGIDTIEGSKPTLPPRAVKWEGWLGGAIGLLKFLVCLQGRPRGNGENQSIGSPSL